MAMAFRLLLAVLLAACSLTALAQVDDDFAEFDDEEGEFDFDMPGELVNNPAKNFATLLQSAILPYYNLDRRGSGRWK